METKYCTWAYESVPGAASFRTLSSRELSRDIDKGVSVAGRWPDDMSLRMNAERPKDILLVDSPFNIESVLVASPALRDFLQRQELPDLEFLPLQLLDHKGRVASDEYVVVQCCRVIDCIDQSQSVFEWDGLDEPSMEGVEKAVFDPTKLAADNRMFRPKYVPAEYVVREDLAQKLLNAGFDSVAFSREFFGDYELYE